MGVGKAIHDGRNTTSNWSANTTQLACECSYLSDDSFFRDAATTAATTCPCVIRLTLLNESDSGEHKFKLVSLTSGFYTSTIEVKANIFA